MLFERFLTYFFLVFFLLSCSVIERHRLDIRYGPSESMNRSQNTIEAQASVAKKNTINYVRDVQPILNRRCVVCHGCYDAPCQLKLSSAEGLERGASKNKVYNAARLTAVQPSRLFEDAQTVEHWRERAFFPVLNERKQDPGANLDSSVMAKLLMLKLKHPLPDETPLPKSFDFSLDNGNNCASIEEFPDFSRQNPLWGMPYGLPQLAQNEYQTLIQWLAEGAHHHTDLAINPIEQAQIKQWELFLNGDSLKHQLMSRYIYEHLYIARLYFNSPQQNNSPSLKPGQASHYYRLIRSKTPPGQAVERIATRRPYGEPGVERVYYRLVVDKATTLAKTHMPYHLEPQRMTRWHELFIDTYYQVHKLPDYDLQNASNPFITFADIPIRSRYKFMLDEAEFTVMGFIKGPVCRGQIALNVIQDHFWVFFVDPDVYFKENEGQFLIENLKHMRLPAQDSSSALILNWRKYAHEQENYLKLKSQLMEQTAEILNLDTIWDGGKKNQNAALTVFRHFDSASVVKGMVGDKPKTAWIIGYSLLERIHYLLVAGFDVYGNYGHQLNTRLYMDFLRLEGEFNFLAFLPEHNRVSVRDEWYAKASDTVKNHLYGRYAWLNSESRINYQSNDYKNELFDLIKEHLGAALNRSYDLSASANSEPQAINSQFAKLSKLKGKGIMLMPQTSFVLVENGDQQYAYTLIHNNAHLNISHLLNEGSQRISEEDTITVTEGFVGSYPNIFFKVNQADLEAFVAAIMTMKKEEDYIKLLDDFAVRRNDSRFWHIADTLHDIFSENQPLEAGIFDFSRIENR